MKRVAGWVLRLLLVLGMVPVALLTVTACCPAGGVKADLRAELRTDDGDIGDLLKQSEKDKNRADPAGRKDPQKAEPNGGVNARGNGGPPAGCPPPVGKPGNSGGKFNIKLFGAKGTKLDGSQGLIDRRPIGKDTTFRMDVENPKPGYVEGNIHVQLGGQGTTHYYWRGGTRFTDKDGDQLPKVARQFIENNKSYIESRINRGLTILGEK
ncbi:hypothetical protein [Microlunatus sp. GCM10028923]|uniref:hypothetical protein n=1 Tax=Microlunatus sp. GCM10028923 TaxID=3273400 RepID=UPI00360751A6